MVFERSRFSTTALMEPFFTITFVWPCFVGPAAACEVPVVRTAEDEEVAELTEVAPATDEEVDDC